MGLNEEINQIYGLTVKYNEPMSNHTTFGVGGNAKYFFTPKTVKAFKEIIELSCERNIPYKVIGSGSNLLVLDIL